MFAVWNITSAMVRIYAAYHIYEEACVAADSAYVLCAGTFVVALVHFVSELLIFRTAKLSAGSVSPLIVASVSLWLMVSQYSFYISSRGRMCGSGPTGTMPVGLMFAWLPK